jgi:hypothetical protein
MVNDFITRIRDDFLEARKNHDASAADALRSLISAIDNASAVERPQDLTVTEVARKTLTIADVRAIVIAELAEITGALRQYGDTAPNMTTDLRHKQKVLEKHLVWVEKHILGPYRHYKGGEYEVIGIGLHTETEEELVVYKAVHAPHRMWMRPVGMFFEILVIEDEEVARFEKQKHE